MAESFPMNGGNGVYSYTKNSLLQRNVADNAKLMVREAIIENLDIQTKTFVIVDMGCSVGPNTFFAMQNVVQAIKHKYHSTCSQIEFHVFFNDHVTNDFNVLFESLFSDHQKTYFAAAIPGSFYGRLFPSRSIHVAYSCYALQWLSRVPKGLIDKKNKGRIHYDGASIDVWNAYVDQFEKDMEVFLSARANEMVHGGLIVLVLPSIPSEQHSKIGYRIFTFVESSLIDMVNEGIVEESLVDSFNLPLYFPSDEDMTKVVEKNGCFSIEKLEITCLQCNIDAKSFIIHIRAGFEGIFTKHFGSKITYEIFERTLGKIEEIEAWLETEYYKTTRQLFMVLKCKKLIL
ncbi:loganic acid O-methyltransferase [Capsicum annuum]|uniref:loganic acid O-methyltransferase n=1 Tax=Capsicum annuum TaxID=4072 RepID=UPI001FB0F0EE|nr:loganic acid O-methyltransferase [Capsicum annuum]